jgi:hypothetical protein
MITINTVWFAGNNICVTMSDGKVIESSIILYPNLKKDTPEQLNSYEIKGGGRYIHWEELDEDLSVEGFLQTH